MEYILTYKLKGGNHNVFARGGTLDGQGLASGMFLTSCFHFTLSDMTYLNGKVYGLRTERPGCEIIANNLYCRCNILGLAGNKGISLNFGDSHFTDCIVVDYTIGIKVLSGSCRLTRCHVWGGILPPKEEGGVPEMLVDFICFLVKYCDENDCLLRDCYSDTGHIGFQIHANTRIIGGAYFNAKKFVLDDVTVIDHKSGYLHVDDGFFKVCTDHGVLYEVRIKMLSGVLTGYQVKRCIYPKNINVFNKDC